MELEEKRNKRLENKKRKIAAYLAVAELNDAEKLKKKKLSEDTNSKGDENKNHVEDIAKSSELVTKYNTNNYGEVSEKPKLEGEEYEELKKRLRERKKSLSCNPLFRLHYADPLRWQVLAGGETISCQVGRPLLISKLGEQSCKTYHLG